MFCLLNVTSVVDMVDVREIECVLQSFIYSKKSGVFMKHSIYDKNKDEMSTFEILTII